MSAWLRSARPASQALTNDPPFRITFHRRRGAVYTEGWERRVVAQKAVAKRTKETINRRRIYPPLTRDRREILAAAAPVVQKPPAYGEAANDHALHVPEGSGIAR
jgi:hypothetical protein